MPENAALTAGLTAQVASFLEEKRTYEDVENARGRCGRSGWRTLGYAGQRRDRHPAWYDGAERRAAGLVAAGAGSQAQLPPLSPEPGVSDTL
jgi:hypothetical protein